MRPTTLRLALHTPAIAPLLPFALAATAPPAPPVRDPKGCPAGSPRRGRPVPVPCARRAGPPGGTRARGRAGCRGRSWTRERGRRRPSSLRLHPIALDHRVREHLARDLFDGGPRRLGVRGVEGDLEELSLADVRHPRVAQGAQGVVNGLALRIEDRFLERHVDPRFHHAPLAPAIAVTPAGPLPGPRAAPRAASRSPPPVSARTPPRLLPRRPPPLP